MPENGVTAPTKDMQGIEVYVRESIPLDLSDRALADIQRISTNALLIDSELSGALFGIGDKGKAPSITGNVDELKKGSFDILEPTSNDKVTSNNCVCIVPGICFDKNGYRIGYGKGYYDKYLSNKSIYKIGICFKECLIDNMPHDLYDIKVDLIVSSF